MCLGAVVVYWAATPILKLFPAAITLPALIAQVDPAIAGLIAAGLVGLMLLTELGSISYCMAKAWKQPRIIYVDDEESGIEGHFKITGRVSNPKTVEPASRPEICAFENIGIIRRRLGLSDGMEIDLLVEEAEYLNAYTLGMDTPGGGKHVICVTSGLVENLSTAHTAAVIGHEMGHIRNRDSAMKLFMGCFRTFASIILFAPIFIVYFVAAVLCWFLSLIPFVGVLAKLFMFLISILVLLIRFLEWIVMYPAHLYERYVSRQSEYMADAAAAHSVGPRTIGRALYLVGRDEMAGKTPLLREVTDKLRMVNATHPSFEDRLEAIRKRTYSRKTGLLRTA